MAKRKTVLLVEDDVEPLEMVRIILDEAGYRLTAAVEGQEALDRVAHQATA